MTALSAFERALAQAPPASAERGMAAAVPSQTGAIRVECVDASAFAGIAEAWMALAARVDILNVFMDPAVVLAVAEAWPEPVRVLLAWRDEEAGSLVGVWAFVERRTRPAWPWRALASPLCDVSYLGTPVVDPDHAGPVLAAMFAAIRSNPALPKLLQAGDMSEAGVVMVALKAALVSGAGACAPIERRNRARLTTHADPAAYWSGSMSERTRSGFARKRRQLGKLGSLAFSVVEDAAGVASGVEEFLALEASGWKAARRSALASDDATASFTRAMVQGLSGRGLVSVQALRLDGAPVAMWIILRSGSAAFTWRTAYDERYGRYSPGVLLLEDSTMALLRDARIATTDSCNHRDTGYQAERWSQRHAVVDLLIDVGPPRPMRLALLAWRERCLRGGREAARRIYHRAQRLAARARHGLPRRAASHAPADGQG